LWRLLRCVALGHEALELFLIFGALQPFDELAESLLVLHQLAAELRELLKLLRLVGFEGAVAAVRPDSGLA
jgi:hypothetical protein